MSRITLNRRLTLEEVGAEADGAGGFVTVWQALGTLWAELAEGSPREVEVAERREPFLTARITVRAAPEGNSARPRAGQRFRDATRVFRILAVTTRDRRGMYLVCHVQEEAAG